MVSVTANFRFARPAISTSACQLTTLMFVQPMTFGEALFRPIHRRMPENAKETRSSAAIRIIARKNLLEDGSP